MSVELLLSLVMAVAAILSGYWALARLVVAQFEKRLDERFSAQETARQEGRKAFDTRFGRMEDKQDRLERDLLGLKADLPTNYVRREDWVRNQSIVEAKLDALALRIENVLLKGGRDA